MTDGANTNPGAEALAAALAKVNKVEDEAPVEEYPADAETLADVLNGVSAEEIARFQAWQQQKLAEEREKQAAELAKEPRTPVLTRMYEIVDAITGASPRVEEQNVSVLKGRVSDADLDAAGVDKEWLIKTGAIQDVGFHYV